MLEHLPHEFLLFRSVRDFLIRTFRYPPLPRVQQDELFSRHADAQSSKKPIASSGAVVTSSRQTSAKM